MSTTVVGTTQALVTPLLPTRPSLRRSSGAFTYSAAFPLPLSIAETEDSNASRAIPLRRPARSALWHAMPTRGRSLQLDHPGRDARAVRAASNSPTESSMYRLSPTDGEVSLTLYSVWSSPRERSEISAYRGVVKKGHFAVRCRHRVESRCGGWAMVGEWMAEHRERSPTRMDRDLEVPSLLLLSTATTTRSLERSHSIGTWIPSPVRKSSSSNALALAAARSSLAGAHRAAAGVLRAHR